MTVVVDIEVVVLVRGADVCLRRKSVTAKTELLASMGVVVELADVVAMVVVMVGAAVSIAVSIAACSVALKSSSSSASSCSSACCSMRSLSLVYSSSELSLEASMASSTWGVGATAAVGRCSRDGVFEGKVIRPFVPL